MAISPEVMRLLSQAPTRVPQPTRSGVWDDYIKPAVMAPLHVLGAGYKGIGTLASALENTAQTGDPLSGFKLGADAREGGLGSDVASALGFGDSLQGVRDPFEVGADALRGAIGGKGARDVDPEWEAAFRAAAPVTTGAEAAGTLAGQFGTQAVLDPVMHGLSALGARAAQGGAAAAEGAAKYSLLPEALTEGRDALRAATQATVPSAIQGLAPETAGAVAKGLGAAFVPGMAISAAENLAQAPAAIKEHGLLSPQAVETGGQGLVDAAFAGLGAYHALRGGHPNNPNTGETAPEIKQAEAKGVAQTTPAIPPSKGEPQFGDDWLASTYEKPIHEAQQRDYEDLFGPRVRADEEAAYRQLFDEATKGIPQKEGPPEPTLGQPPAPPPYDGPLATDEWLRSTYEPQRAGQADYEKVFEPTLRAEQQQEYEDVFAPIQKKEAIRQAVGNAGEEFGKRVRAVPFGERGGSPEQEAARLLYREAEDVANEMNKRGGGAAEEVTPDDVLAGRAPIQAYGAKGKGGGTAKSGGVIAETPEAKRNILAALAARLAQKGVLNNFVVKQSIRDGIDSGRLAEMLQGKLEEKGLRPKQPVLTPDREITEHDVVAGEAGFPDDKVTPTRQEDPLAGAAERMAALKARKAAEAAAEAAAEVEDPFERKLREAAERAKNRPAPETTVVESPRLTREPPPEEPSAAPVEPAPTAPKNSGGAAVKPELWKDTEGEDIEGDWKVSPEQAKRANEMGLDQDTAELLSKPLDEFEAVLSDVSPLAKSHLAQLYRKFNNATIVTGKRVEGKLPWDRAEEPAPAAEIRPEDKPLPDSVVKEPTPEEIAEKRRLQEEAALRSRYTAVQAKKEEPKLGGNAGPFKGTVEASSLQSGKGPSLLEKMAARKAAEGLKPEEKASIGTASTAPQPVADIISHAREVWKDRIAKAEPLEDGGTRLHMKDGRRLEIHPSGEILGAGPDIAGRAGPIKGSWRPLGNADSYIRLVEGKATFPDFLHEAGHGAIWSQFNRSEQKALFEKHRQEIFDRLKVDSRRMTEKQRAAAEEIVVDRLAQDAARHLEEARRGNLKATPGWFRRLWDYITRIVRAFKGADYDSLVRDFASGQIFDRGRGERAARATAEWMRGERAPRRGAREAFAAPDRNYGVQDKLGFYSQLDRALERAPHAASGRDWARYLLGKSVMEEGFAKFQVRPDASAPDISSLRKAVDEAKREKERLQEKGRALRGPEVAANQASVREATKRVKEAEEALLGAGKPLDENRPPLSIRGQSPRDARSGIGPDAPPRVELRKRYMQELRKEQGKEPFDWSSNVPQARRFLIPKVQRMLDTMTPEQLFAKTAPSPEKVMAQDAFIAGRRADREVLMAQKEKLLAEGKEDPSLNAEAIANGFDLQIAEMTNLLTKYGYKQVEYNTAVARTLAAMNDIMSAGRSLPDSFLRDIFRKHPSISPEKATALADLVREGKYDALPDALFAAVEPGAWAKFLEYWKSGLVSAVGTLGVANPGGNVLEGAVRIAEAPFGVLTDMVTTKLTGERSRTFGEAGAEAGAIKAAARPAWDAFKTDLGKIFRGEYGSLAELDETARKKGLHEMLQYPPAIGAGPKWAQKMLPTGHVGNAVRVPLYILSATDAMFRRLGVAAELGKLSHREAVKALGMNASKEALAAKASEISRLANEPGSEYEHLLGRAQEEAAKRVFQNDAPALRSLKSLRANLKGPFGMPIGHLAIPFTDTPFNIFKMMIERSPLGGIGAGKAWKRFVEAKNEGKLPVREMEKLRDNAIDLTARAALGTTMFGLFIGAARAGLMTGAGPTDPKAKKALMETGWQPYSFRVGDTYIPFNRFEPVSSILGFSADAVEIANKGERESYVKKAAAAFMTNALSKTYLQGLSDAAGLIVDPERYGPDYAASLVGSLVPNIVAKGAQAIDPVMRETRPPGTGVLGQIGATLQSRVPGASMTLPEQRTLTGEVRERPNAGSIAGALSRFALPVQVTQRRAGSELQEEFARVGYTPPVPDRKIRVSGQDIVLAPGEQDKLAEEYQKASARATRLLQSPAYKSAPDDADGGQRSKKKLLDRLYDEANDRFKARYASILRARARAKAASQPGAHA